MIKTAAELMQRNVITIRPSATLSRAGGDKSQAARILGWNRMKLYRRMKSLGISYGLGKTSS